MAETEYSVVLNRQVGKKHPNLVKTSKYKWWNFLFLNLAEQFRRLANLYFVLVIALQLIPGVSPFPIITSIAPVIFILSVSAIKEAIEDYGRHRADWRVNHNKHMQLAPDGTYKEIFSQDIAVGSIMHIRRGEEVPADMVVLQSASVSGSCAIVLSSLDGEALPKMRNAVDPTQRLALSELAQIKAELKCQQPTPRLYSFTGMLQVEDMQYGVSEQEFLLRSGKLVEPDWVNCVVVYVGAQTKMMLNRSPPRFKFSRFETSLNAHVRLMFFLQIVVCVILTVFFAFDPLSNRWAIQFGLARTVEDTLLNFLTQFILFSFMIPMPLYVTMEVSLLGQGKFMAWDKHLYGQAPSEPKPQGLRVKNASINPELGQIEYIFTDKTGTLTENNMTLNSIFVQNQFYYYRTTSSSSSSATTTNTPSPSASSSLLAPPSSPSPLLKEEKTQDNDVSSFPLSPTSSSPSSSLDFLVSQACAQNNIDSFLQAGEASIPFLFFLSLLLCNSAVVVSNEGEKTYQSDSPDEVAFLKGLGALGLELSSRVNSVIKVFIKGTECRFSNMATLPFLSSNQRMSVVVRVPSGRLFLMVKGADSMLFSMLQQDSKEIILAQEATQNLALKGSRTLVVAGTEISEDEFEAWLPGFREATVALVDREIKIEKAFRQLEKNLSLYGCTAVDDQMQAEVPHAIDSLLRAGIKVLMLTGDKKETAVSVARDSHLIQSNTRIVTLEGTSSQDAEKSLLQAQSSAKQCECTEMKQVPFEQARIAVVVEGRTLEGLLESQRATVLTLIRASSTIVCYRSTPAQKSLVVKTIKSVENVVCLAVGDGANDVSMLTEANVGVGVLGKEGSHAAMASDYVITRFHHLLRLILVHGRYSHLRTSLVVLTSFYKNWLFPLPILWFGFSSGASGNSLYDSIFLSFFTLFSSAPPFILGLFEQDLVADALLTYPETYHAYRTTSNLSKMKLAKWISIGLWQSLVLYFCAYFSNDMVRMEDRWHVAGLAVFGNLIVSACVLVQNIQLSISYYVTICTVVAALIGIVGFFALFAVTSYSVVSSELFGVFEAMFETPSAWLYLLLTIVLCFLPSAIWKATTLLLCPTVEQRLQIALKRPTKA